MITKPGHLDRSAAAWGAHATRVQFPATRRKLPKQTAQPPSFQRRNASHSTFEVFGSLPPASLPIPIRLLGPPKTARESHAFPIWLRHFRNCFLTLAALLALTQSGQCEDVAAPQKQPDRREMWVPFEHLARVLDKKAVLLTREQYDVLLRDAGLDLTTTEAPRAAMISATNYRARVEGDAVTVEATVSVNVLRDSWALLPLKLQGIELAEVKFDKEGALIPPSTEVVPYPAGKDKAPARVEPNPHMLLLRGRGLHQITAAFTVPISNTAGLNTISCNLPATAGGSFALILPADAKAETDQQAGKVETTASGTAVTFALSPTHNAIGVSWRSAGTHAAAAKFTGNTELVYRIDAESVSGVFMFHLASISGGLPSTLEFTLPAEVKILSVKAPEINSWQADAGKITVQLQPGDHKTLSIAVTAETASLVQKTSSEITLPVPALSGLQRMHGTMSIQAGDDVTVKGIALDASIQRTGNDTDAGQGAFSNHYQFTSKPAPRVTIERVTARMEADLDTLVSFQQEAIFLERTVTLREDKGLRFSTSIQLPDGEEFLSVKKADGSDPDWRMEVGVLHLKWADRSTQPRVFKVYSRITLKDWTTLPADGVNFILQDAKIEAITKLTGYIALTADPAYRLEAVPGEMMERRDGRNTPVRGEYAWFRRDAIDLKVKITRKPAEVLATLTGYVLPMEGVLDLHAALDYQFLHGGTRAVKIRVPKEFAHNFQFEAAPIAERTLEEDVWTLTFQKELTGSHTIAITAQIPVTKKREEAAGKSYSFEARVPAITPLDAVRTSGIWAVEANTETEITFETKGVNDLDALAAPRLADYRPRHRVIGTFGWLGSDYSLVLQGVRHSAAAMPAVLIDALEIDTLLSTSGLQRHQALLKVRTAGAQYLDATLPGDTFLLSLTVDGNTAKPVASGLGQVRIPLPARQNSDTPIAISLVYETPTTEWKKNGDIKLAAPKFAKEIPVTSSRWQVWMPDGFEYSAFQSNLAVPEAKPPKLLLQSAAYELLGFLPNVARSRKRSKSTRTLEDLRMIDAAVDQYAIEFNKSGTATVAWKDVQQCLKSGTKLYSTAPNDMFGNTININTQMEGAAVNALDGSVDTPNPDSIQALHDVAPTEHWAAAAPSAESISYNMAVANIGNAKREGGLLPVMLELPKSGNALVFHGLYAADHIQLRYHDWWSKARRLWMWFVAGGITFYFIGRARPWWRTLWVALLLSAFPLCISISAMTLCNALLGGWLSGLVLNRIAVRCSKTVTNSKEALV